MQIQSIIDTTRHDALSLSVIMPSVLQDIDTLIRNVDTFFRYLPIKNIYVAAPENVRAKIESLNDRRLIFVCEDEFADVKRIRELYLSRTDKNPGRAGWYVQQFIKMAFSRFTKDEYYLIWDSDTIPLKPVSMFDDNSRPFFDMKTEYHRPYFATMGRLIPGLSKTAEGSFISEHMVIKSSHMDEMLREIESNPGIDGRNFQEKIINAADAEYLPGSGFSEFETYGSYVMSRHPDSYILRKWTSLRTFVRFYRDASDVDDVQRKWLSQCYDAVTIEKAQRYRAASILVRNRVFRKIFRPSVLERVAGKIHLLRRIYRFLRRR